MADNKLDFIIQNIDKLITSADVHEIKENIDPDYSFLIGISISDVFCSAKSILDQVKIKGTELIPEKFEAVNIMSSSSVQPNKRFFSLFKPVKTSGDEIVIKFHDPDWAANYNLQIQVLLANNPEKLIDVLLG
jgi:hypothetical protein